ncbi:hypothetical protein XENORESO_002207 [Xenotaenia resolanae]|uniref:Uncharacterized protein n=1 Tax=Xenotaenia resolanae TaxID=208358 RepID=A0ABV0VYC8_9TELE
MFLMIDPTKHILNFNQFNRNSTTITKSQSTKLNQDTHTCFNKICIIILWLQKDSESCKLKTDRDSEAALRLVQLSSLQTSLDSTTRDQVQHSESIQITFLEV